MSPRPQEALFQQMARLPEEDQERVLDFVKGHTPVAAGVSGKDLLKFSGAIGQADLQAMTTALEEGCAGTR